MAELFSSKANTLNILQSNVELAIPPFLYFSLKDWKETREQLLENSINYFSTFGSIISVAVRSSCLREDGTESSGAGAFTSLLYIKNNRESLTKAIEEVFQSYSAGEEKAEDEDQVIIQLMLENIIMNGVIMTYVSDDGSPYYVINYDLSNQADTITSGRGTSKLLYVYRDFKNSDFDNPLLYKAIETASLLEKKCNHKYLDIEFCITADNVFHLLQVRPICTSHQWITNAENNVQSNINHLTHFLTQHMQEKEGLHGESTILGVMPDWNPAEIIGITPKQLPASLYRELITRRVWSEAREFMGYKELPPDELMLLIAGRPYIDVRLSFNSFLPQDLPKTIADKLINAWLDRLNKHTYFHDKIEFEIAQTMLDFTFEENMRDKYPNVLTDAEKETYKNLLRNLTQNNVSMHKNSSFIWAMDKIEHLRNIQKQHNLFDFHKKKINNPLRKVLRLVEECKKYGTLPFSILARHAFMAESLLRSAVLKGAITEERLALFKSTLKTISTKFSHDFIQACKNPEIKDNFLSNYGHLRPSSYEITSPRYIDRDGLFSANISTHEEVSYGNFQLTTDEEINLNTLIKDADLNFTAKELLHYANNAIPAREYSKFIFTRHLSDILEYLAYWGNQIGLSREDLSFLDYEDITRWVYHPLLSNPHDYFSNAVEEGKNLYDVSRSLKLPYILRSPRDLYVAPQQNSAPNFIGSACIEAPIIRLTADSTCSEDIKGHIVCIENADPGFDWIFTRKIAGLITLFGGANSHMSIRCAEYSLPAAIGVGSTIFNKLAHHQSCILDAQSKRILF